jgi:cell division protein FtsZ
VNEAARVITEHVDRDAKIIFGAGITEKLKKGEVKVTVVATGFSGDYQPNTQPVATMAPNGSAPVRPDTDFLKADRPQTAAIPQENGVDRPREIEDPSANDDFDIDIPAFIRRKMR